MSQSRHKVDGYGGGNVARYRGPISTTASPHTCCRSHVSMQPLWKWCAGLQGRMRMGSPSAYSLIQITQEQESSGRLQVRRSMIEESQVARSTSTRFMRQRLQITVCSFTVWMSIQHRKRGVGERNHVNVLNACLRKSKHLNYISSAIKSTHRPLRNLV